MKHKITVLKILGDKDFSSQERHLSLAFPNGNKIIYFFEIALILKFYHITPSPNILSVNQFIDPTPLTTLTTVSMYITLTSALTWFTRLQFFNCTILFMCLLKDFIADTASTCFMPAYSFSKYRHVHVFYCPFHEKSKVVKCQHLFSLTVKLPRVSAGHLIRSCGSSV